MELTTDQKGAVAELAVAKAAVEAGVGVYVPFGDERADMILELGDLLLRTQCKWAARTGDVLIVRAYRCRRTAAGLVRRFYDPNEIDVFAAYSPDTGKCYLIPHAEAPPRGAIALRLSATKNNQERRIRWAKDYEFDATLKRLGAIAQLGERLDGIQKVAGSSPAGSTSEAAR